MYAELETRFPLGGVVFCPVGRGVLISKSMTAGSIMATVELDKAVPVRPGNLPSGRYYRPQRWTRMHCCDLSTLTTERPAR